MINPIPALSAAIIWAISPIYYRDYLVMNNVIKVNFYRLLYASLALLLPFIVFGFNSAIVYGALSGLLTLAIGDTLYLLSIRDVGASIAAPVAYTYVLLIQFAAVFLGESISVNQIIGSILIVIGIYMLSNHRGSARKKGIMIALLAALIWTIGQSSIKLATLGNINPFSIAFARTFTAMSVLGLFTLINRNEKYVNNVVISKRRHLSLAIISISDLGIGSALYIYSIGAIGLAITIILTSISPLITQIASKILGKEAPSVKDIIAGSIIVFAIIISTGF